jgi:hypothetical protein
VSQWRRARPEVVTAGILVASAALAGLAVAGWPGLAIVTIVTAALTLLVLRVLAPRPAPDATRKAAEADSATMRTLSGYSQRRFLAARLAERHGVNLYTDPDAARRAFVRTRRDDALWRWIDPAARETPADAPHPNRNPHEGRGIPRQTLARLIDKLEHL